MVVLRQAQGLKIFFPIVFLFFSFFVLSSALAYTSPGTPTGFVNDFGGMLSAGTRAQIEADIRAFEQKTGHEISVVTIPSLGDDYIENYAEKLFKEWGIGKKGADNGALLLIARDDRKMRIEVGYGLEGALTDAESSQIIRNTLTPAFKRGDFDGGVTQAVSEIERAIQEEAPIQTQASNRSSANGVEFAFWMGLFVLIWLHSVLARTKSWWLGGVVGGIIGFAIGIVVLGFILQIFWWIIGVGLLGLGFDFLVSKNYQQNKTVGRRPSWWAGGGWGPGGGFGGGGGGGFGGFGGGGSGGGGSSGGW